MNRANVYPGPEIAGYVVGEDLLSAPPRYRGFLPGSPLEGDDSRNFLEHVGNYYATRMSE